MAIKLIVDSASDISRKEAEEMGVEVIPMTVSFGAETFFDGVDLLPTQFYERLIENDELPKTGQITQFRFEEAFARLTANGDEVVLITISSKLSATWSSAVLAAQNFEGRVWVVDSMNACIGERLLCQYAIRMLEEGLSAKAIAEELELVKSKIVVMAMVNTLEYLKKGGRVSAMVAFAGEMLSIKPVILVADGEVKMAGKARGSKNANNLLNSLVEQKGGIDFSMPYGTIWSGLDQSLLQKYIADSGHLWQAYTDHVPSYILGATIGTHVGPGAVGVAFFTK